MGNPEIKFLIGSSKGKWSKFTVDTVEYVIKFDVKEEGEALQSITCSLSDYQSMWAEKIASDEFIERLKRCNPLLACKELMSRIIWTVTGIPQNENNVQITAVNGTDCQHLSTKYFLSDGSDPIPLKFYWSLEKVSAETIYKIFNEMLMKISDLEKENSFLDERVRNKDQELDSLSKTAIIQESGARGCSESVDTDPSTDIHGICHEGITCSNCGVDIFGNRYICLECEDYDLCMTCERKGKQHTHHIMVRFAQSNDKMRSQKLFRGFIKRSKQQTAKRIRSSTL